MAFPRLLTLSRGTRYYAARVLFIIFLRGDRVAHETVPAIKVSRSRDLSNCNLLHRAMLPSNFTFVRSLKLRYAILSPLIDVEILRKGERIR